MDEKMTIQELNKTVEKAVKEFLTDNIKIKYAKDFLAETVKNILIKKHGEYALDEDALSNFKNGGKLFGETPELVLLYYKLKHDISIKKLIEDLPNIQPGLIEEKIVDNIAYLVLLYAHLKEREHEVA